MARSRYLTALSALFALSCSVPQKSNESEFLQRSIVPQIGRWAAGTDSTFSLAEVAQRRRYEVMCLAPEYYPLTSIEKHVRTPIERYHSDFGSYIPENRMALIAVRGGDAHAAALNLTAAEFRESDFEHPPKCVEGGTAIIERTNSVIRLGALKPSPLRRS